MEITAYTLAERFTGMQEVDGPVGNPQIVAMLQLDSKWPKDDEVAWCSAFVNFIAWLLRLVRSKSLAARSWLGVGKVVESLSQAERGFDIIVLKRGGDNQPGPEVLDAQGHVAFFSSYDSDKNLVWVLGGNQSNSVNLTAYPADRVLGIRRLS